MLEFVFHPDTQADFQRIVVKSPSAKSRIVAALEAASEDATLLNNLSLNYYRTYGEHDTDIKRWVVALQLGYTLRRFRFLYLEENGYHYRIVYATDDVDDYCYILAILRRDEINYDDPNDPINQRIFTAYTALGL